MALFLGDDTGARLTVVTQMVAAVHRVMVVVVRGRDRSPDGRHAVSGGCPQDDSSIFRSAFVAMTLAALVFLTLANG